MLRIDRIRPGHWRTRDGRFEFKIEGIDGNEPHEAWYVYEDGRRWKTWFDTLGDAKKEVDR